MADCTYEDSGIEDEQGSGWWSRRNRVVVNKSCNWFSMSKVYELERNLKNSVYNISGFRTYLGKKGEGELVKTYNVNKEGYGLMVHELKEWRA
jgi:hypothetical protein